MTYWGELADGTEMLLGEPAEAQLLRDSDAPADQLRAVFPTGQPWEELTAVRVFHQGQVVFGGVVDEQNTSLSEDGLAVELVCRSWEALLLDNEARPAVLASPSLETLWKRYLEPLGLAGLLGDRSPQAGELAVEKGQSCWQLLEDFCQRLGITPWVDGRAVLHCEGEEGGLLQAGKAHWAQLSQLPCKRLSAVWQQSFRGTYDTPFRDDGARCRRQRFVSMEDGRDPRQLLRQARRESWLLTVECPGVQWPGRGGLVTVEAPLLGRFENCPVRSARYTRDSRGQRTRLVLERGDAACG